MPRDHRQWTAYVGYFETMGDVTYKFFKQELKNKSNILIMIRKKETEHPIRRQGVFKQFCDWFPKETKTGQLILSKVPDISKTVDLDNVDGVE